MSGYPTLIQPGTIAAISGNVNGRCSVYFDVPTEHAMRLLDLFVECMREERAQQAALAEDDGCWEWG